MSESKRSNGVPSNSVKGSDYSYFPGCGGSGAGPCVLPATFSYVYWPIKVNPFSTRNNLLVLFNETFIPRTNTPTGLCANNPDQKINYDILLMYDEPVGIIDRSKAVSIVSIPATTQLPFEVEFSGSDNQASNQIPQPIDNRYKRTIWVVIDLFSTGLMLNGIPQKFEALKTIKLNYEISQ